MRDSAEARKGVETGRLIEWINSPATDRGLHFATDSPDGDLEWEFFPYSEIARFTNAAAAGLVELGVERDDVVVVVLPTGVDFAATFMGVLLVGGTPCPLPPPALLQDTPAYLDHVAGVLRTASPTAILANTDLAPLLAEAVKLAELDITPRCLDLDRRVEQFVPQPRGELALLQFTSGSTGSPRGVRLTWENLAASLKMMAEWCEFERLDKLEGASWLPVHHDMGLIGVLLIAFYTHGTAWLMRPDQFLRFPLRWLECFGKGQSIFTASPSFGFSYIAKKVKKEDLQGMDFSRWRGAVVGAERVDPSALDRFAELLEPFGFRREAFLPAYGLAEATLAVTGSPLGAISPVVLLEWSALSFGEPVKIRQTSTLGDPAIGNGAGWLVGCGSPIPGVSVRIIDDEGSELPDSVLGEIAVRGLNVSIGYLSDEPSGASRFVGGEIRTGDAGFLMDGNLFVIGRIGDSLKVRGRNVYVEDLESRIATVHGIPTGGCVVLAEPSPVASPTLVVIVERDDAGDWVDAVARKLRQQVGSEVGIRVFGGPRGTILRTTSGKPRRRLMWQRLLRNDLPAKLLLELPSKTQKRVSARA